MKKVLALVLALVMVIGLAACGGGNTAPAGNNTNNTTPEPTADKSAEILQLFSRLTRRRTETFSSVLTRHAGAR